MRFDKSRADGVDADPVRGVLARVHGTRLHDGVLGCVVHTDLGKNSDSSARCSDDDRASLLLEVVLDRERILLQHLCCKKDKLGFRGRSQEA